MLTARDGGDAEAAGDVEADWRTRLRRLPRSDPAAAEPRELLDELAPQAAGGATVVVVRNSIDGVVNGSAVQGRDFSGGVAFHDTASRPAREGREG